MWHGNKQVGVVLCGLLLLGSMSGAIRGEEVAARKVFAETLRGTAWILVPGAKSSGTAWIVDHGRRLLVTNHHVVEDQEKVVVLFPMYRNDRVVAERKAYQEERGQRGRVVDVDISRDLAVIELIDPLPEGARELKLAAESCQQGDRVHSVGNPAASAALWVYTSGSVRSLCEQSWPSLSQRTRTRVDRHARVLETQSPINPGDSGGPVVNDQGELVAVTSAYRTDARLISLTIDVSEVRPFVEQTRRLQQPETAADFNLRGVRRHLRKQYDQAIADFTKALQLAPKLAGAYRNRGHSFIQRKDYDSALADLNEAVRLDPRDASAYKFRGLAHERQGALDQALADYTQAIRLEPSAAAAYYYRGDLYYQRKLYTQAITDFNEAIRLEPNYVHAYNDRGNAHFALNQFDAAIASYDVALKMNPLEPVYHRNRGHAFLCKGDPERAIQGCLRAVELKPDYADGFHILGKAQAKKGDFERAWNAYSRAIELSPQWGQAYFSRAAASESAGQFAQASRDFHQASQLDAGLAQRVKTQDRSQLRIANDTGELLHVHIQYETLLSNGTWKWYPADGRSVQYDFAPGESARLAHENWTIKARRVHIWAEGKQTGQHWPKQEVRLVPADGYLLQDIGTTTYTFSR